MFARALALTLIPMAGLALTLPAAHAAMTESAQVAQEACGDDPQPKCLGELRKVCHDALTFRCYYSRKGRLDAIRQVGFPGEQPHFYDE